MTDLRGQAERAESEVVLIGNAAPGTHRIESEDLVPADELGNDEFPQYGEYLETVRHPESDVQIFVECPPILAKEIADQVAHNADLEGRWFKIFDAEKEEGRWQVTIEVAPADAEFGELPWQS